MHAATTVDLGMTGEWPGYSRTLVSLLDFTPPPPPPPKKKKKKNSSINEGCLINLSAADFNRNGGSFFFLFFFFQYEDEHTGVSQFKSNQLFKSCRIQVYCKGSWSRSADHTSSVFPYPCRNHFTLRVDGI